MQSYNMQSYNMRRFTIIAPYVTNEGEMSNYPQALREGLINAGIDGWTEHYVEGTWRGKREPATMFEILRDVGHYDFGRDDGQWNGRVVARELARIARRAMPDQEAIQITVDPHTTTVYEG